MPAWTKILLAPLATVVFLLAGFAPVALAAGSAQSNGTAGFPSPKTATASQSGAAGPSVQNSPAEHGPIRFGQVDLPMPPGYAEVRPDQYPGYFGSVAYDAFLFNQSGLVRLFIPAGDMPLLRQERYDALRRNIQVTLPGLVRPGDDPSSPISWEPGEEEEVVAQLRASIREGKPLTGLAGAPMNDDSVAAWLEDFPPKDGRAKEALLSAGFAFGEEYALIIWMGDLGGLVSYGLFPNRPLASVLAMCIVEERLVLISFNQVCAVPEDVRTVRETAVAYLRDNARAMRVVPAEGSVTLNAVLDAAELPQRFVVETLVRRDRLEEALAATRMFLDGCRRHFGDNAPTTLGVRLTMAGLLLRLERYGEAATEYERFLADGRKDDPPSAQQRATALVGLGKALLMELAERILRGGTKP